MTSSVWTLRYRPKNFSEVVGQTHIRPVLKAMVSSGEPHHALIFAGTRGTGKTTVARILAAALNCEKQEGDACGECGHCESVAKSNSTSVLEIDAASSGGVDNVRQIKEICAYAHENEWRVVLLDEAHSMSRDAFNALLKTLEEPPPNTVFILLTTEVEKILPTIRSRSMLFEFRRLSVEHIVDRLRYVAQSEGVEVEDDLLTEIARRSDGGMRDAVMLLDQVCKVGVKDAEGFAELFGMRDVSVAMLRSALEGEHAVGYGLIEDQFYRSGDARSMVADMSRLVRDLMVLKAGGTLQVWSAEGLAERQSLADAVAGSRLVAVSKVLWQLQDRARLLNDDQRSMMDVAYALIADALVPASSSKEQVAQRPEPVVPKEKMSLGAMRAAMG